MERQANNRIQPDTKSQCDFVAIEVSWLAFVQLILSVTLFPSEIIILNAI
jgi:hypothetical protein